MSEKKQSIILKLDFSAVQTVGEITKIVGLIHARYLVPVIDRMDLRANPRSSKTSAVTAAIESSIETDPDVFPFKTKGLLLAASQYEHLDRGRIRITPQNPAIEGILDGGHNTLAIGLYILKRAMAYKDIPFPRGSKTWDQFKRLWQDNHDAVDDYLAWLHDTPDANDLSFYLPVELLLPRSLNDPHSVESFKNDLAEICAARNNNVQLPVSAKANQLGFFDPLRSLMESRVPELASRIEWKPNEEGDVKVQDLIALAWIPLSLVPPVSDGNGRTIEPIAPQSIYSGKGNCLKQFERFMSSPEVTAENSADYRRELINNTVLSAFRIAADLPELYDYIFEKFPELYNAAGGIYGRITAVKKLNEKRSVRKTPFFGREIRTLSPEGFVVPLVYGLKALMTVRETEGAPEIVWAQSPMEFMKKNLQDITANYTGLFDMCDYDPQKIGKNPQSYQQVLSGFKMAIAGIL